MGILKQVLHWIQGHVSSEKLEVEFECVPYTMNTISISRFYLVCTSRYFKFKQKFYLRPISENGFSPIRYNQVSNIGMSFMYLIRYFS